MSCRIAFISDIHSNLTALEAVLDDIKSRKVDYIVCLGDIIGKGPRPNECTSLVRKNCRYVIKGNLEVSVLKLETKAHGIWNNNTISEENKKYLDNLPLELKLDVEGVKIKCIHGFSNSGYLKDISRITELDDVENIDSDLLIYADIHHQYVKKTKEENYIFNTGSVGLPLLFKYNQIENKNIDAEYLIIDIDKGNFNYEFIFVPYDKDLEVDCAIKSSMPHKEKYIREITTGKD